MTLHHVHDYTRIWQAVRRRQKEVTPCTSTADQLGELSVVSSTTQRIRWLLSRDIPENPGGRGSSWGGRGHPVQLEQSSGSPGYQRSKGVGRGNPSPHSLSPHMCMELGAPSPAGEEPGVSWVAASIGAVAGNPFPSKAHPSWPKCSLGLLGSGRL